MARKQSSSWVLVLIGCGKLLKAAALVLVALAAHRLVRGDAADKLVHWIRAARVDPDSRFIHGLISNITGMHPKKLAEISVGSLLYASLFAVEGVGLIMRKRWAEYVTVITTSLLLPLEIYEMFHGHHHAVKVVVFIVNLLIVIYLIARLRNDRKR